MRSFWAGIARLQCHCHCYTCIENRHVHVRKLFSTAARIRSGRINNGVVELATGWNIWRQQPRRGARSPEDTRSQPSRDRDQIVGSRPILHEVTPREERRKQKLQRQASDLHSLSIHHWSLNDIVNYEPRPGGSRPPSVPSTTKADPNLMMPQSPWASDSLKRQNYARVWTRKKIAKMETAVARFVLSVCQLTGLEDQKPFNLLALPEAIRPFARLSGQEQTSLGRELARRTRELRNDAGYVAPNEDIPIPEDMQEYIPHYDHMDDGLHHELLRDLNASLVELFEGYKYHALDFLALMVKICHNLLVSSAPPNVQTMNIILLGFYSMDKHIPRSASQVQVKYLIMDWLIAMTLSVKIRPNEITCAVILATYRQRGMRTAFTEFVVLMRGEQSHNALMFTRPLKLTRQSSPRLTPTHDYADTQIFKQAVYPAPMIFAEVIKGVARFYALRDAIAICKDFTAKEWGYDWSCLRYLLDRCITQKDWESGLWVWEEVTQFRKAGHAEPVMVMAAMLALCVQCQQGEMFASVLAYANSTPQVREKRDLNFVQMATDILERAVESMDDESVLAMGIEMSREGQGEGGGHEDAEMRRGVHEHRVSERHVKRRLADDAHFRRAAFGFGERVRRRSDLGYSEVGEEGEEDGMYALDRQGDYASDVASGTPSGAFADEARDSASLVEWEREQAGHDSKSGDGDFRQRDGKGDLRDWASEREVDSPKHNERDFDDLPMDFGGDAAKLKR